MKRLRRHFRATDLHEPLREVADKQSKARRQSLRRHRPVCSSFVGAVCIEADGVPNPQGCSDSINRKRDLCCATSTLLCDPPNLTIYKCKSACLRCECLRCPDERCLRGTPRIVNLIFRGNWAPGRSLVRVACGWRCELLALTVRIHH